MLSEFDRRWNEIGLTDTDLKDISAAEKQSIKILVERLKTLAKGDKQ